MVVDVKEEQNGTSEWRRNASRRVQGNILNMEAVKRLQKLFYFLPPSSELYRRKDNFPYFSLFSFPFSKKPVAFFSCLYRSHM